jgi:diguanylate cyclase (GGDEF)-like protein
LNFKDHDSILKDTLNFAENLSLEEEESVHKEVAQSYEVVKKLLPFMAKRGIPISPKNFRLFHDYIIHAKPELNKTINEFMDKNIKFHSQITDNLYAFFYPDGFEDDDIAAQQARAISQAAATFIGVSNNMAESLINVQDQQDNFMKVLSHSSRQMADMDPDGPIQPYLEGLLTETRQTLAATDTFSSRLKEANEIIATLKEELQTQTELARVDELTKLSNRHHLKLEAPRFIREALEKGQPRSAIMFDIDFFKKVNDTWGHDKGDTVLRACADIIKNEARSSDLAVRLGGEEFLLLCANLSLSAAANVADRVRQSIASAEIDIQLNRPVSITVSGGVAEYVLGEDISSLIARADAALYQAKAAGRNRVRTMKNIEEF